MVMRMRRRWAARNRVMIVHNIQARQEYANLATNDVVRVVQVNDGSIRFHDLEDDTYVFVEDAFYFQNDYRLCKGS